MTRRTYYPKMQNILGISNTTQHTLPRLPCFNDFFFWKSFSGQRNNTAVLWYTNSSINTKWHINSNKKTYSHRLILLFANTDVSTTKMCLDTSILAKSIMGRREYKKSAIQFRIWIFLECFGFQFSCSVLDLNFSSNKRYMLYLSSTFFKNKIVTFGKSKWRDEIHWLDRCIHSFRCQRQESQKRCRLQRR
jgi:hypothetical protein